MKGFKIHESNQSIRFTFPGFDPYADYEEEPDPPAVPTDCDTCGKTWYVVGGMPAGERFRCRGCQS